MFHQSVEFLLQLAILVLQPSPRRQRHVQSRLVLLVQFQQLLFQRGHLLPKFGSILVVKRNGTQQRYVSRWVARRSVKGPLKKRRIEVKKKHFPENRLNLTISAELIGKHQLGSWRQKNWKFVSTATVALEEILAEGTQTSDGLGAKQKKN